MFLPRSIKYSSAKRGAGTARRAHVPLKLKYCTWARKRRDVLSVVNQINWILIIKKCAQGLEEHKEALALHTGSSTFRMWLHCGWIAVSAPISEMYPERQFQNWTSAASNHPLSSAENANSLPRSTLRLGSWLNSVDWILNVWGRRWESELHSYVSQKRTETFLRQRIYCSRFFFLLLQRFFSSQVIKIYRCLFPRLSPSECLQGLFTSLFFFFFFKYCSYTCIPINKQINKKKRCFQFEK